MARNEGFAKRLPAAMFPAGLRPFFEESWSYAALGGLATALLLMVAHVFGIASSTHLAFRHWLQVVFDPPTGIRIAAALAFVAAIVSLRREPPSSRSVVAERTEAALAITAALAGVMVVGAVIGAVDWITYLGSSVKATLDAVFFELAVMVLSAVAGLWSLAELDRRRRTP
jgi:hypothetical protein